MTRKTQKAMLDAILCKTHQSNPAFWLVVQASGVSLSYAFTQIDKYERAYKEVFENRLTEH